MRVYLTVTFEYASAEEAADAGFPGDNARSYTCEPVSDTPPVVLSGLVRGGCFLGLTEWFACATRDMLCLAADERIVNSYDAAKAAERRGALPITWYRYEAP